MNHDDFYINKGLSGLVNLGNTCFMNTAIQCLSHTIGFTHFILTDKYLEYLNKDKKEYYLTLEWSSLIKDIWSQNQIIKPDKFLRCLQLLANDKEKDQFLGFNQEDTTEFLNFLIDSIHESISREVNIVITGKPKNNFDLMALNAVKSWKQYFENQYSICVELFYGQYVSKIMNCKDNDDSSFNYEPFFCHSLEIPDKNDTITIYDCLSKFCNTELLYNDNQWNSDKYNQKVDALKQIMFWKTPQIFIISFKRNVNMFNKNNKLVEFPLYELNLQDYCVGYDKYNSMYDLFAVCNHNGGAGYGHYWAYCKNPNGQWYSMNDSNINEISSNKIISNNAYCLFYKKRET